jgi:hypothetical protein
MARRWSSKPCPPEGAMSVARIIGRWLIGLGLVWAALGLALSLAGIPGLSWFMIGSGLILAGAAYFERHRYKPQTTERPGLGWIETDESFIDPETDRKVTVYFHPASGERRYVQQR